MGTLFEAVASVKSRVLEHVVSLVSANGYGVLLGRAGGTKGEAGSWNIFASGLSRGPAGEGEFNTLDALGVSLYGRRVEK